MKRFIILVQMYLCMCTAVFAQELSFKEIEKKAKAGDVEAMYLLGDKYLETDSYKDAAKWFQKAAKKGSDDAKLLLASLYLKGQGVTRNTKKAYEYVLEVAMHGRSEAQYIMGTWYESGLTGREVFLGTELDGLITYVEKDADKAVQWYAKAAAQGDKEAIDRIVALNRGLNQLPAEVKVKVDAIIAENKRKEEEKRKAELEAEEKRRFLSRVDDFTSYKTSFIEKIEGFEKEKMYSYIQSILSIQDYITEDSVELKKIKDYVVKNKEGFADIIRRMDDAIEEANRLYAQRGNYYSKISCGEVWKKNGRFNIYGKNGVILHRNLSRIGCLKTLDNKGYFVWDASGRKGFINDKGKLIIPFGKYTNIIGLCNTGQFVLVKKGNKVGAVDYTTGKQLIAPVYDSFGFNGLEGRTAWTKKNTTGERVFIFNKSGGLIAQRAFTRTNYTAAVYWVMDYLGGYLSDIVTEYSRDL